MEQACWISQDFNAEWKKPSPKGNILHYSVYTTFSKWQTHRCREQMYGHQGGKVAGGGGVVMNWEIGIDIYTLICINWITNKNLLHKKINKIKFKNKEQI